MQCDFVKVNTHILQQILDPIIGSVNYGTKSFIVSLPGLKHPLLLLDDQKTLEHLESGKWRRPEQQQQQEDVCRAL